MGWSIFILEKGSDIMTSTNGPNITRDAVKKVTTLLAMKGRWRQILENGQNRYSETFRLMSDEEKDETLVSLAKSFTAYIDQGCEEDYAFISSLTDEFGEG